MLPAFRFAIATMEVTCRVCDFVFGCISMHAPQPTGTCFWNMHFWIPFPKLQNLITPFRKYCQTIQMHWICPGCSLLNALPACVCHECKHVNDDIAMAHCNSQATEFEIEQEMEYLREGPGGKLSDLRADNIQDEYDDGTAPTPTADPPRMCSLTLMPTLTPMATPGAYAYA